MANWSLDDVHKKKPANFNAMTARLLKKIGWEVELAQSYNAQTQRSRDLLGFADLIAFMPDNIPGAVLIQACGTGDRTKRLRKILSNSAAREWIKCRYRSIWLMHWSKRTIDGKESTRWNCRTEIIEEIDFKRYQHSEELPLCPRS